ncbi:MAG: hypothetical protein HUJ84_07020 [Veillonella sp.]|nr:hypothetical protein [Veillonella sp.]
MNFYNQETLDALAEVEVMKDNPLAYPRYESFSDLIKELEEDKAITID